MDSDVVLLQLVVLSSALLFGFFALLAIVSAMIWAFIDDLRRHDHSGRVKVIWALVILSLPLFGPVVYLSSRPTERNMARRTDGPA